MQTLILTSAAQVFTYIGYILCAIAILLVMITIHEAGHYVAGKILKFKIKEFAIGFGPKIYKHVKKNGEIFSIRALPLGGFCAFDGDDGESETDDPNAFNKKKPWQRIIVLISGALMNLILALLVIFIMLGAYGLDRVQVTALAQPPDDSYIGYTLEDGDIIEEINGRKIFLANDLTNSLKNKKQGDNVSVRVRRNGKSQKITVKLFKDAGKTNVNSSAYRVYECLGIKEEFDEQGELTGIGARTVAVRYGFFTTIGNGFVYHYKIAGTIFQVIGQLLTGKIGLSSLGGPVTTVKQTADMVRIGGFRSFLQITAFIGVNLGVFNLLPLPALDGSHVIFTLIEWIRKKPVNRKVEAIIHVCGFVFLIGFALLVDLLQFLR